MLAWKIVWFEPSFNHLLKDLLYCLSVHRLHKNIIPISIFPHSFMYFIFRNFDGNMLFITIHGSIISLDGTENIALESCRRKDVRMICNLEFWEIMTQSLPATSVLQVPKIKPASLSVNVTLVFLHLSTSEIFIKL